MKFSKVLNRNEMKNIMAGSGGQVYIECCGCQNSTCKGWYDDCSGRYELCGAGPAGGDGPCATCKYTRPS